MQPNRWLMCRIGLAATLAVALFGCADRTEQTTSPTSGPTVGQQRPEAAPAQGLQVVTLNVKGMH